MKKLFTTYPAKNYKPIGSVNVSALSEVKQKVKKANQAKQYWKELGIEKRVQLLQKAYEEFSRRKKDIALIATREMGKPIGESDDDIGWDLSYFKSFLEQGPKYLEDEI